MNQIAETARSALLAGEAGFDPIEERLRYLTARDLRSRV
jgi:hypothetical protein